MIVGLVEAELCLVVEIGYVEASKFSEEFG